MFQNLDGERDNPFADNPATTLVWELERQLPKPRTRDRDGIPCESTSGSNHTLRHLSCSRRTEFVVYTFFTRMLLTCSASAFQF